MTKSIKLPADIEEYLFKTLASHKRVKIIRLGIFEVRKVKARKLFHNFSGKIITIPRHARIHFRPSLTIKKTI